MCGIYSILNRSGKSLESFQKDFEKIQHRGPDNSKLEYIGETIIFGFHRLRINGIDEISDQPLYLSDVYLICNGEIYNKNELVLKYNFDMKTNSDCEVILHMYSRFGIEQTLNELDGEYAFCMYDQKKQLLIVSRDHIGIRPLFIGRDSSETIGFASEAKALVKSFNTVKQLEPGKYYVYNLNLECNAIPDRNSFSQSEMSLNTDNENITKRWYNYDTMNLVSNGKSGEIYRTYSRNQILSEIKYRLIKSVNDRTDLSERPVGCFLSGGLDSSLVTSIMSKRNKNVHCFSIGIEGSLDLIASEKVSKFLGLTNHHIVKVTVQEAISAIPYVIKSLESYDITTIRASTFQWMLSKYIKENTDITVLLSGEIPDESIPGYWAFSFCKTDDDFIQMSRNMIEELHEYDLLRTDRTTAAFGLEVRVPYAQKELMALFHNIPTEFRKFDQNTIEKLLLRDAFREGNWLPDSILNRKKHAFSDGVDGTGICFHKEVENYANTIINKNEWDQRYDLYPVNTPVSKESFYYRKIFESLYPDRSNLIRGFWMPKIKDANGNLILNPSATALPGHKIDTNF